MEKAILTTGGTGGHIFPALAVAEELRRRHPAMELLFVGGEYGMEKDLLAKTGIPFLALPVRGVLGRGLKSLTAMMKLGASTLEARKILKGFAPDVVAGFGGYASFPTMLAAKTLGIPALLHEQNAIAGASNKILARLGVKVCATLPGTSGFAKIEEVTGNPVRASLRKIRPKSFVGAKRLFVLGGSQGAAGLNRFMADALPYFAANSVEIIHQCGKKDEQWLKKAYKKFAFPENSVRAFIDDIAGVYEWADLILCRSGASTIAEICIAGVPAVFVPFPAAIHDHQTWNAKILQKTGGALLVPESELETAGTREIILKLLENPEKLAEMSSALLKMARPEAAARIVDNLEKLAKPKK